MRWLATGDEGWKKNWAHTTVRRKLPEFLGSEKRKDAFAVVGDLVFQKEHQFWAAARDKIIKYNDKMGEWEKIK